LAAAQAKSASAEAKAAAEKEIQQKKMFYVNGVGGFGAAPGVTPRVAMRMGPARKEKAAFLGVVSAPVQAALREQLQLKPGVGLVVEAITKDSPAEVAGIKQYDILEKLDDQWLINSHQFATLVRMHKPDEQVSVTLIRQGKRQTINAKLVEKEMAVMDDPSPWSNMFTTGPEGNAVVAGQMDPDEIAETVKGMMLGPGQNMSMNMSDDEHTLVLNVHDGKKHLLATDKEGNIVFNGPIDTEEQRKSVPADIAAKLKKLESKPNMIRLKAGRPGATTQQSND
jgi:hypothetical protein